MTSLLVVHYDRAIRTMIVAYGQLAGFSIREADTTAAAYHILRASDVALVVLYTYRMPDATGLDLLRAASERGAMPHQHAFIEFDGTTLPPGAERDEYEALVERLGIPRFLVPYDVDELIAVADSTGSRLSPDW